MKFVLMYTKSQTWVYLERYDPAGHGRQAKYSWTDNIHRAHMFDNVFTAEQYIQVHKLICAIVPYDDPADAFDRAMKGI